MRYLKYIILSLLTSILTLSCVKELEDPTPIQQNAALTLVPRVKSFSNQYVTKAYESGEAKITRLAILVFDENGNLIHLQEGSDDAGINSLPLNKSILNKPSATVVMFANVNLSNIRNASGESILDNQSGLNIRDLPDYAFHFDSDKTVITDLGSNFKGFPMAGIRENVNLSPTATKQGAVDISLQILYAKVTFEIGVENGNENTGTGMKFDMTGYSIHNVSTQMSLTAPEGATDESAEYSYADTTGKAVNKNGTVALNGTPLKFTFYVAESRYEHNSNLKGIYPSDDWLTSVPEEDVKNYYSATDEAKLNGVKYFYDDLIQQYKPKLANVEEGSPGQGLATYVLLKGTYTDYRGTVWTVNYKVYLGKDNALNFHVDRNSEYTNYITIKGIRNNDGFGDEDVWLDHRVTNVSTTDPAGYVTITRETLIDAHIEVRPMRVKWDGDTYAGVRIYLPTDTKGNLLNWIGIERFITGANCQDSATYCYADGESTGKRRYFTTDLISELQTKGGQFGVQEEEDENGNIKKFIYLQNGDCAWIYFDEHVSFKSYPTQPSPAREAVIKLEFVDDDGNKKAEEIYNVKQLGLQRRGGYTVESYEEYLHSYDSADKYNLSTTPADYTQQGLAWGLADKVVSQDIIVSRATIDSDIIKDLADSWFPDAKYDFFADDDKYIFIPDTLVLRYAKENGVWTSKSGANESGLAFTNRATKNKIITVKDMGSAPENAYQYCLSKNKFEVDEEGNVAMKIHWYLPDVHQLAKVLNATAEGSSDFRSGDYYWSSQPSFTAENTYEWNTLSFGLLDEVPENARARSKGGNPKDFPRSSKNRIRCLYAKNGQEADMTGRTPDGVGGLTSVIMKGYTDASKSSSAYFINSVKSLTSKTESKTEVEWPDTNYPKKKNSYNVSDAEFEYVVTTDKGGNNFEGFKLDPSLQSNWDEYNLVRGYYHTLRTYPGLTRYTLDRMITIDGTYAYKPTTTEKSVVETITSKSTRKLTKDLPSSNNLDYLDHLKGSSKFNISFAKSDGTANPVYIFDETVSGTDTTNTYNWSVPVYTSVTRDMPQEPDKTVSKAGDSASSEMIYTTLPNTLNAMKQATFAVAYATAKTNAESALNELLKSSEYAGWQIKGSITYDYPSLQWDSSVPTSVLKYETREEGRLIKIRYVKCIVKLTAIVTLEKPASETLYKQTSGGEWKTVSSTSEPLPSKVNTDEFRMYCGNSFTISLSDEKDADGLKYSEAYEITKVIVHYLGDNLMLDTGTLNKTYSYARFVDSSIELPYEGDSSSHLGGLDYDEKNRTQQWAGSGTDSITLTLADYVVSGWSFGNLYNNFTYTYDHASKALDKYIVIDKIEVKCTKKAQ